MGRRGNVSTWKSSCLPQGSLVDTKVSMEIQGDGILSGDPFSHYLFDANSTSESEELAMDLGFEMHAMAEVAGLITPPTNP